MGLLKRRKQARQKGQVLGALGDFELPRFPDVIMGAVEQIRRDDCNLAHVAASIERDPSLSVSLLRVANSAAYGLRNPARSVRHAVMLLGRSEVEALLLSQGVARSVGGVTHKDFEAPRFWRASARRAATARAIAQRLHPVLASESFTAALLQDMAIPLLVSAKGDAYGELLKMWRGGEGDLDAMERDAMGFCHAEVGRWVCEAWSFPVALVDAISAHHGDEDGGSPPAVRMAALIPEVERPGSLNPLIEMLGSHGGIASDDARSLVEEAFERGDELAHKLQ